tara:strand:+ start:37533 stop:40265 length:2733 start_codon:yes stop_codon:yes gene_type:complete
MKTLPSCLCILGFATASLGGAGTVLLDNIGADDGSNLFGGYGAANQIFEAAFSIYDIGALETFENPDGLGATSVQAVVSGFPGTPYVGPDGIEGWSVNFYSGSGTSGAYCTSLIGDVANYELTPADVTYLPDFAPNAQEPQNGCFLVTPNLGGGNDLPVGLNTVGVIPINPFGTNGQMVITQAGADASFPIDPDSITANPGEGFGSGPCSDNVGLAVALRVFGGTADPCGSALPLTCPADVSGPVDEPDGQVNVSDLLAVIANWNAVGDGSFRPVGDCRPLPNGDCEVNVTDLLGVIAEWGSDCVERGACCFSDGSCVADVAEADCSGTWLGVNSTCDSCLSGACCAADASCTQSTEAACAGNYQGDGTDCASVVCGSAPDNNTCATATSITDGETAVSTVNATTDGPSNFEGCVEENFDNPDVFNDVYFSYTASCEGIVTVSLCDTVDYDSRVIIYDTCDMTNVVACNDDGDGCADFTSLVTFGATAGSSYIIRVGGYTDGTTGSGTMNVSCEPFAPGACCLGTDLCQEVPGQLDCESFGGTWQGNGSFCFDVDCDPTPANNLCEDATEAVLGANAFDTTFATAELPDPDDTDCADTFLDWASSPDVWFSYTPAEDGSLTIDTCDAASYDTSMVLYTGDCANLVQVACNGDDASGSFSGCQQYYSAIVNFQATGGTTYYIRLGGWNGATGAGTLNVAFSAASAVGACCVAGNCEGDNYTFDECVNTLGGLWGEGQLCADVTCPQPYLGCAAGDELETDMLGTNGFACVCPVDGFNTDGEDCNGGINQAVQSFTGYTFGASVCGEASVYVDGPTGGTYRDLDWYENAEVDAGGNFTISIGSSAPKICVLFNLTDSSNNGYQNSAGFTTVGDLEWPAGDNVVLVAPIEWDVTWTCGTGSEGYTFSVGNAAP